MLSRGNRAGESPGTRAQGLLRAEWLWLAVREHGEASEGRWSGASSTVGLAIIAEIKPTDKGLAAL